MASKNYYPPKKNPLLAATLGIVPGLGHLYNEQVGKGIFLISLCIGVPFLAILSMMDIPLLQPGYYHGSLFGEISHQPALFSRLFVVLVVCVFLPLLVVYSMADAAATAAKINRGEIPLGGYPTVVPPPPPHHSQYTQPAHFAQEAMPMNTSQFSSTTAGSAFAGSTAQTNAANDTANTNGTSPQSQEQSKHGRLIAAVVLIGLGFFCMVDDWGVSFLQFENFWPLIPLFFGLRLLREYQLERSHSQKILGIIFTAFGGVFLINNWMGINLFKLIGEFWYLIPLAVGFFILFKDLNDKRLKKSVLKNGNSNVNGGQS